MKQRKGFTLIELLAVIVILAIIALIATPAIINVIENARKKAFENTAYGVLEGLRLNYTERVLDGTTSVPQEFTFPNSGLKLSGEQPAYGEAKIDSKGGISFALADRDKKWCAKKDVTSEKVTIEDYTEENCKLDGTSGGETLNCDGKVPNSFEADTWETIACAVKAGNLSKYNVGDEKEVTLTGEYAGTYTVRIANTSKPTECDGVDFSQSACGFVVEFKDIITRGPMNSNDTSIGGWPQSELHNLLNTKIYNELPSSLKNIVVETKVISNNEQIDKNYYTSTDKLYLFAIKEIWGKDSFNNDKLDTKLRQLDYYKNIGVTTSNYSGAIKSYQNNPSKWWLRSASISNSNYFFIVEVNGVWNTSGLSGGFYGVAPAFRIG